MKMGFSKIWVHGEASDGVVASITLELLAKARELAETVEAVSYTHLTLPTTPYV